MINGYIKNAQQLIEQLKSAISNNEYHAAGDFAHTLDGSSRSIGAKRLAVIANKLYETVQTSESVNTQSHIKELITTFEQTCKALYLFIDNEQSAAS